MIQACDLSKTYEDGTRGLVALHLTVDPGMIYCLLGANGAGKTTTINLFLNFIQPTGGKALINQIDVTERPLEAKVYVAALSENVIFYPTLTGRQNLNFFARLANKGEIDKDGLHRLMLRAGLPADSWERPVRSYSKGMRQKLGLAVAIPRDAPALLLDEPLAGLDPKAARELVEKLQRLRDDRKAILISTHDVFRARVLADRVGVMRAGRKVAEWNREELVGENLESLYLRYMTESEDENTREESL